MTTFQTILVPSDFSLHSAEALRVAAIFARSYAASLTLVHVFDPVPFALTDDATPYSPEQHARLLHEIEKRLAVARRAAATAGAETVFTRVLLGAPAPTIVEYAEAGSFDLIVMGTQGRTGLQHVLMGSVAEKVVRQSSCPVLTVRAPADLSALSQTD